MYVSNYLPYMIDPNRCYRFSTSSSAMPFQSFLYSLQQLVTYESQLTLSFLSLLNFVCENIYFQFAHESCIPHARFSKPIQKMNGYHKLSSQRTRMVLNKRTIYCKK